MKVIQCPNGHFYDGDKFDVCPHCTDNQGSNNNPGLQVDNFAGGTVKVSQFEGFTKADDEVTVKYEEAAQDEKTVALWEEAVEKKSDPNIPDVLSKKTYAPVVGWLVCMEGVERGRDYRLHGGRNFIGRSLGMDVSIPDDPKLTRDNHASIIYDMRSQKFFLLPGETSHTALNDQSLDAPAAIFDGDIIEVGGSKLCFISFCKEGRTW